MVVEANWAYGMPDERSKVSIIIRAIFQETEATSEERNRLIMERDRIQRQVEEQQFALAAKDAEKSRTEYELRRLREEQNASEKRLRGRGDCK